MRAQEFLKSKLLERTLIEFDPGDNPHGRFRIRYTFTGGHEPPEIYYSLNDAISEVEFLQDADPRTKIWPAEIYNIDTQEVVWQYDPDDTPNKGIQFRKRSQGPDNVNEAYPISTWQHETANTDRMTVKLPDGRAMDMYVEHKNGWAVFTFLVDEVQYATGGGDAANIFGTARQGLINWVQLNHPKYVAFTGELETTKQRRKGPDRIGRMSFYNRIITRLASMPEFQGWSNITERPDLWPEGFELYMDQHNPGIDLKTYILASPGALR